MKADRVRLFPLGHPFEIASACADVLNTARERWCHWPQLFDGHAPCVTVEVHDGSAAVGAPTYRTSGPEMLLFSDPGNLGSFSAETKTGLLRVSRKTLDRREWFWNHLLQPLVLTGLDMVFFDPLHAACVVKGENTVLLAGESGAGKTTLAYACTKAGWTLVSEDGVRLASDSVRTLVGGFWVFRLREPTRALFPELKGMHVADTANGKAAIHVDASANGLKTAWEAKTGKTIFLSRRPGRAEIRAFAPEVALAYFLQTTKHPNRSDSQRRLESMLNGGCHLLEYEHVQDAVAELERLA